uniref:Uncharacterized protein n=1 Tax=Oryza sativa subsp. japonica TaxID=39947 RepID=Q69P53_ORYSJ|nr:hypothetical protein [Oryza sativa Japonica Group]
MAWRAWRQRKAMVTDATCANTLAAAQHGKELPGAARSTMAAAHSDVSVRHGNGKFPVGDYTTRPASADENFPHHHQREMQRGNIFHHHLLRAASGSLAWMTAALGPAEAARRPCADDGGGWTWRRSGPARARARRHGDLLRWRRTLAAQRPCADDGSVGTCCGGPAWALARR